MTDTQDEVLTEEDAAYESGDDMNIDMLLSVFIFATFFVVALLFSMRYVIENRPQDPMYSGNIEEVTSVTAYRDFGERGVLSPNFDGAAFEFSQEEKDFEIPLGVNIFEGMEDSQIDAVRLFGFDLQGDALCFFLDVTPEQPGGTTFNEETGLTSFSPFIHERQEDYPSDGQDICNELARLAREAGFA